MNVGVCRKCVPARIIAVGTIASAKHRVFGTEAVHEADVVEMPNDPRGRDEKPQEYLDRLNKKYAGKL